MTLELKTRDRFVPYSAMELKIFNMLSGVPISTHDLIKKVYKKSPPFHARATIVGLIRSLSTKIESNKESLIIKTSGRKGPKPMEVWIEKKEKSVSNETLEAL